MNTQNQANVIGQMANPNEEQTESSEEAGQENQGEVNMPMQAFLEEHKALIELLMQAGQKYGDQQLIQAAQEQTQEVQKYEGEQGQQPQINGNQGQSPINEQKIM